jgi:hypothetical protein
MSFTLIVLTGAARGVTLVAALRETRERLGDIDWAISGRTICSGRCLEEEEEEEEEKACRGGVAF